MTNQDLANEVLAPLPEVALSEPDYRAFCAALEASARGRAFLAEYARRNRHADTATVLAALDRLETLVRGQSAPARAPSALPPEVAALIVANDPTVEVARSHLAVVPRADEPELPIPAPAAGPPPAIALVHDPEKHVLDPDRGWEPVFGQDHAQTKHVQATPEALETIQPAPEVTPPAPDIVQRSVAVIPEVNLFDGAPVKPAVIEPVVAETVVAEPTIVETRVTEIAATPLPAAFELTLPPPAVKRPASPPVDPLAHIMALSDEERIALFS